MVLTEEHLTRFQLLGKIPQNGIEQEEHNTAARMYTKHIQATYIPFRVLQATVSWKYISKKLKEIVIYTPVEESILKRSKSNVEKLRLTFT